MITKQQQVRYITRQNSNKYIYHKTKQQQIYISQDKTAKNTYITRQNSNKYIYHKTKQQQTNHTYAAQNTRELQKRWEERDLSKRPIRVIVVFNDVSLI